MSWGGSVLGMINSLKANARKRPSLKRGYPRLHERDKESGVKINYRKIRALSDEERSALRKRVAMERRITNRKSILALGISLVLLLIIIGIIVAVFGGSSAFYKRIISS